MAESLKLCLMRLFLLMLLCYHLCGALECTGSEVSCSSGDHCIPVRYICDGDNDCDDKSDEDTDLCSAWLNERCDKGEVVCERQGINRCMDIQEYCSSSEPPCEGDLDRRICHILNTSLLQPLSNIRVQSRNTVETSWNKSQDQANIFLYNLNQTINHPECPDMFTLVGDQCLSAFTISKVSWGEAREICRLLGGDLLSFRNVSHYAHILSHLQQNQVTHDFWVGGRYVNETASWAWMDGSPMQLGSPFWAVRRYEVCNTRDVTIPALNISLEANRGACYHHNQAPEEIPRGPCAALSYEHYFYMIDEDCVLGKSPLCVHS